MSSRPLLLLYLRTGPLHSIHLAPTRNITFGPAPERAPATHWNCHGWVNQSGGEPAIEGSERYSNSLSGLLCAVGLFHLTPFLSASRGPSIPLPAVRDNRVRCSCTLWRAVRSPVRFRSRLQSATPCPDTR